MVRIIADSAADLEPQELEKYDIECIPMQVSIDGIDYKEGENLTKEKFYELLESKDIYPKTSQPTPYDFEVVLKKCMDAGEECVVITVSSGLSGTYQNACLIKDMLDYENCYVVDSLSVTAGERVLVDYAVKLRDEGKSAKEICDSLNKIKNRIRLFACIDTLEYLHKGGRLSKTAYAVGTLANIKPILRITEDGKIEVVSKAMSIKGGVASMARNLEEYAPDLNFPIYAAYSNDRKNADMLIKAVEKRGYNIPEENVINIGVAIGAHAGCGACGLIYVVE